MTNERNDMLSGPVPPVIPGFSDFSLIATGSVFITWRARQDSIGREVLVRVLREGVSSDVGGHAMRIAKRLSILTVDGLERIITIGEDEAQPYLILEEVPGKTLSDLVEEKGVLPEEAILRVARRIASVLKAVSAKDSIVLRSLKPQNLHVDDDGNVMVSDFSLAIISGDPVDGPSIDDGNIIGTPQFFSPEQASGAMDIDCRADMYALGLVLYFLATRKTPFDGHDAYEVVELQAKGNLEDPRAINKDVSDDLAKFIARLAMKNPADRYADWDKVLEDLDRLQDKRGLVSSPAAESVSTVALTVPDRKPASANRKGGGQVKVPPRKKALATGSAVNPYGREEAAKAVAGSRHGGLHAFLWLLLLVWLGWLANCRMGNPLHLPPAYAPEVSFPVLDSFFASLLGDQEGAAGRPAPAPQVKPLAPEAVPEPAPVAVLPVVPESPVAPAPAPIAAPAPVAKPKAAAPTAPAWFDSVVAPLRKGDREGAKDAAMAAGTAEAGQVASLLSSLPSVDDVFATVLLRHKDEVVPIVYMGKERKITPVRREGDKLITRFQTADGTEKIVPIQLSKVSAEEKNRWLQNAETEAEHAAVAIEALKAGDHFSASLHANRAGALAPFLKAALK